MVFLLSLINTNITYHKKFKIMLQNLLSNRKTSGLILGGLAALAYYKYTRMTPEEKSKWAKTLSDAGKGLLNQLIPGTLKNDGEITTGKSSVAAPNSTSF